MCLHLRCSVNRGAVQKQKLYKLGILSEDSNTQGTVSLLGMTNGEQQECVLKLKPDLIASREHHGILIESPLAQNSFDLGGRRARAELQQLFTWGQNEVGWDHGYMKYGYQGVAAD